ncbi:MAG: trypsin-like peptidase domain-containing protein, partial [Patescibacteria group bacterium]
MEDNFKKFIIALLVISVIFSGLFGGVMGYWAGSLGSGDSGSVFAGRENKTVITVDEESAVIEAVETVSPAVVSIIVTKDLPKVEQYQDPFQQFFQDQPDYLGVMPGQQIPGNGETEKKEVGGGSGFIVSSDGYIVTNKHVVNDEAAEYTVLMNDGEKYPAKVLAKDQINDIAIMKIDAKKNLPTVRLGDSFDLKTGQTVIVIGNALGEFRNTVSTGVISGLSRSITATGNGIGSEQLVGVIQTDASINLGNSGGPLVDIAGQV